MSESLKLFCNIRLLRKRARTLSSEILEDILNKLTAIVLERREEDAFLQKEKQERREKIERLLAMMLEDGLDPSELTTSLGIPDKARKSRRAPLPPKYEYLDDNGQIRTWTGQGRTPKCIVEQLASGATLKDFEIKK